MAWLAAGAIAGGAASYLGGNKANEAAGRHLNTAMRWMRQLLQEQGFAGQAALGERRNALGAINRGYKNALAETQNFGQSQTQMLLDREQQQIGGEKSDLINSGQYNPQHLLLSRRGISYDTGKGLLDIAWRASSARSALNAQYGLAQAGQYGDIAGQIMANFMGRSSLQQNRAQIELGAPSGVTDYSHAIGSLFGAFAPLNNGASPKGNPPDSSKLDWSV